jgi:hypothetical protein
MAGTQAINHELSLIRRSRLDQAGFRDDLMDVLIVKLDGDVIHNLNIKGNGDALGTALGMSQQAVVVATTAAQAFAIAREGKTGNEDDVERSDVDGRAARIRLPDVHLAAMHILHGEHLPWLECLMFDLEEAGAHSLCMQSWQQMSHQIRLVLETTKESDGDTGWPGGG